MDFTNAFGNGTGNGKPPGGGLTNFDATPPAPDYSPIPGGRYLAVVVRGEVTTTRAGDDAYRIRFEITEGEYAGRLQFKTFTFGPKALAISKRDLAPFGLTTEERLYQPFPETGREYHVRLVVALQRGDDGREYNDVKRVELLRVDESPAAAFRLPDEGEGGPQ